MKQKYHEKEKHDTKEAESEKRCSHLGFELYQNKKEIDSLKTQIQELSNLGDNLRSNIQEKEIFIEKLQEDNKLNL